MKVKINSKELEYCKFMRNMKTQFECEHILDNNCDKFKKELNSIIEIHNEFADYMFVRPKCCKEKYCNNNKGVIKWLKRCGLFLKIKK